MSIHLKKIIVVLVAFTFIGLVLSPAVRSIDKDKFGKITLDLKDVSILDVLKIFSMHSGMSIVAGQDVRARVTIFLKDVNAWNAFEVILAANNLAYKEKNGIIKVMTQRSYKKQYGEDFYKNTITKTVGLENARAEDVSNALNQIRSDFGKVIVDQRSNTVIIKDTAEKVKEMLKVIKNIEVSPKTKVFELKYADPKKIVKKLKENLTQKVGSVEMDKRTRKITVTDIPPKLEQITKMVKSFDTKPQEVLIDTKIVEVALDKEYRLGIDWNSIFKKFDVGLNVVHGNLIYNANIPQGGVEVIMDAFKTMGEVRVISNPKILALNQKEASIKITERQPYVTTNVSSVGQAQQTQVGESVQFMDIGTKLSVTPIISKEGYVTMEIEPKVSSAPKTYTYVSNIGGQKREIPIERTSEGKTTVMVKDGRAMVLGGLMKKKRQTTKDKVPVLRNIPVVGNLFQHQEVKTNNTELTIFLTPHILSGDEGKQVTEKLMKEGKKVSIPSKKPKKEPTFSWLRKGKKSAYTDYYLSLSSVLSRYIAENYTPRKKGGRVNLILTVNSDGELKSTPKVINTADSQLAKIAKRLVSGASPFPPFPEGLKERESKFRVSINLPSSEEEVTYKKTKLERPATQGEYGLSSVDEAYSEYYLTLSELISNYMEDHYPSTKGGKVEVSFSLSQDGKLIERPRIVNTVNPQLKKLTIQAMRELSPFPPFPDKISGVKKRFTVLITIPEEGKEVFNRKNKETIKNYASLSRDVERASPDSSSSSNNETTSNPTGLSYREYKRKITKKISKHVKSSQKEKGEVKVAFTVGNNGELINTPRILNDVNRRLANLTIGAIKDASPFPKLPETISENQAIFEISIVYN